MKTVAMTLCAAALSSQAIQAKPVIIDAQPVPFERVSFADLNLNAAGGQQRLEARIRAAANRVCSVTNDRNLEVALPQKQCANAAVADGMSQMRTVVARYESTSTLASAGLTVRGH